MTSRIRALRRAGIFLAFSPALASSSLTAQVDGSTIRPGAAGIDIPDFQGYEVEYTSAFGRFFNRVQTFRRGDAVKISVLNPIEMPDGVIVDSKPSTPPRCVSTIS